MLQTYLRSVLSHVTVALAAVLAAAMVTLWSVAAAQTGRSPAAGVLPVSSPVESVEAVTSVHISLWYGVATGAAVAVVAASLAAYIRVYPLIQLRHATANLGAGDYYRPLPAVGGSLRGLVMDLDQLRSALADTETRRRRLLGEVAHEMRTPLTIIDGYVEGMIDGIIPLNAEELGHVTDEVRRLRRLSDDLSALSRAEEGRLDLRLLPCDLRQVVASATRRLLPQVEDAGLRMDVRPGSEFVPVYVDPDRLAQVVRNLIGNAVRATPPGGAIRVRIGRCGRWACLSIRDDGEGIDPSHIERIFERFYRVPGRRESRGETGSGIGLTIAREIVRAHGGELVARSAGRGCGAEFIGWLRTMW